MRQPDIDRLLHDIQEHYGEDTDLVGRYRDYAQVDAEKALRQMRQRLGLRQEATAKTVSLWRNRRYVIAATLALLIVGGLFWYWQYTKVTPPVISEEIQQAMARCEESGNQAAEVSSLQMENGKWEEKSLSPISKKVRTEASQPTASAPAAQSSNATALLLNAKRVTTRQDKEYWVKLPDGTVAHLNYNTRLIYPEQFTGETRDVILEGEAYLMVAKDKRHPFIVHTRDGDIRVYGTEFNVNTRDVYEQTKVVLVEGAVSVKTPDGDYQPMQPGELALLSSTLKKPLISPTDVEPYVAWNTGRFVFEDCPLEKLMNVLSRWYGYQVQFDAETTRQLQFTGELDKYSSIEPTLRAINKVMGLRIELNSEQATVFITSNN